MHTSNLQMAAFNWASFYWCSDTKEAATPQQLFKSRVLCTTAGNGSKTVPPSPAAHSTPTFFPCRPAQGDRVVLQMPPSIFGASSNCEHEVFFFGFFSPSLLSFRTQTSERFDPTRIHFSSFLCLVNKKKKKPKKTENHFSFSLY